MVNGQPSVPYRPSFPYKNRPLYRYGGLIPTFFYTYTKLLYKPEEIILSMKPLDSCILDVTNQKV